jgi:hypothetical protein
MRTTKVHVVAAGEQADMLGAERQQHAGAGGMASRACSSVSTSIQVSPGCLDHGLRVRISSGTPAMLAASTALALIWRAKGWVASTRRVTLVFLQVAHQAVDPAEAAGADLAGKRGGLLRASGERGDDAGIGLCCNQLSPPAPRLPWSRRG